MVVFFSAAAAIALVGAVALAGGAPAMASAGAVRMVTASAAATNFFIGLPPWMLCPNAPRIVPGRRAPAPARGRVRLAPDTRPRATGGQGGGCAFGPKCTLRSASAAAPRCRSSEGTPVGRPEEPRRRKDPEDRPRA